MTAKMIDDAAALEAINPLEVDMKAEHAKEIAKMLAIYESKAFVSLCVVADMTYRVTGDMNAVIGLCFSAGIDLGIHLGQAEALENMHKGD